jgi:hypothetical protein
LLVFRRHLVAALGSFAAVAIVTGAVFALGRSPRSSASAFST